MLKARSSDILALALLAFAVGFVSPHTTFVLLWWGGWAWGLGTLLFGSADGATQLRVFVFYGTLALVVYLAQLWAIPGYYGFSGGIGVGTDDSYFYSLATNDLPFDYPYRFALRLQSHHYGDLLRVLANAHSLVFPSLHPLDLLFFNVCGLSFLPLFVRGLHREFIGEEAGARTVFWMCVIAPYVLSNGVILMRDGWMAMTFAGVLWAFFKRRWPVLLICLALSFWLRIASSLMLVGVLIVLALVVAQTHAGSGQWRRKDSLGRVVLSLVGLLALALIGIEVFFHYPWWERVFRSDFLASFVRNGAAMDKTGTTTFFTISQLPVLLRLPLAMVFFLGSPFLQLSAMVHGGALVPRAVLANGFALLFPLYAAWFFRGVSRAWRDGHRLMQAVAVVYIVDIAIISQASMQMRHKIPLMALFYLLAAYGSNTPHNKDRDFGWLVALLVILADGAVNTLPWLQF